MARPKRSLISRQAAVATALELIDRHGMASFSLERLGQAMGVKAPSLYYHFADRAELLSEVARAILLEVPLDEPSETDTWEVALLELTSQFRAAILRHPNAAALFIENRPQDFMRGSYNRAAEILDEAEVPARYHLLIFEGLEKLVLGSVLHMIHEPDLRVPFADLDRTRLPALGRAVKENRLSVDELFVASCRMFLWGVRREIDKHVPLARLKPLD